MPSGAEKLFGCASREREARGAGSSSEFKVLVIDKDSSLDLAADGS